MGALRPITKYYPELIDDWDFESNAVDPSTLGASNETVVHWKCHKCGYEWDMSVNKRARMRTPCPVCSGSRKLIIKGKNDLETLRPDLMIDWDWERNTKKPSELRITSHYQANWKCHKCGHTWSSRLDTRTANGSGCPVCNVGGGCSIADYLLYSVVKSFFKDTKYRANICGFEVDTLIEGSKICIEYDGLLYHEKTLESDLAKQKFIEDLGYFLYRIRERDDEFMTFSVEDDILYVPHMCLKTFDLYKDAYLFFLKYLEIVPEDAVLSDEVEALTKDVVATTIHKPSYEKSIKFCEDNNMSDVLHWDYEKNLVKPEDVFMTEFSKRYFKCFLGHSVLMRPDSVYQWKYNCPVCSSKTYVDGVNDLNFSCYNASVLLSNLCGFSIKQWTEKYHKTVYTCPDCGRKVVLSTNNILSYNGSKFCRYNKHHKLIFINVLGVYNNLVFYTIQADKGFIFLLVGVREYLSFIDKDAEIQRLDKIEFGRLCLADSCTVGKNNPKFVPYHIDHTDCVQVNYPDNIKEIVDFLIHQRESFENKTF